ncbi:hypothetical protein GOODEAATRI_008071 [Goodea atripinnis]|uniref:Uncharacterized protein n=1 Tax=Goodea atripinnis TaxID=208336 RepID=A0ABV0PW90_9TELE
MVVCAVTRTGHNKSLKCLLSISTQFIYFVNVSYQKIEQASFFIPFPLSSTSTPHFFTFNFCPAFLYESCYWLQKKISWILSTLSCVSKPNVLSSCRSSA